jgi:guanylate kinase
MNKKGVLIVLSGFSGAGKGTIVKKLLSTYDNYALSISMTTRSPRPGEEHGREYFFVEKEVFEEHIAKDELVEYAQYVGNYYGTPKAYVEEQLANGKDVILEIEIQGALKIKERFPQALLLFVTTKSAEVLRDRLVGRGTETQEVINNRLARAVEESEGIGKYEYIIVNDDLDACVEETHAIIQKAKAAAFRNEEFIKNIQQELKDLSKGEK